MPKICDVKDVPVGGIYRSYDAKTRQPKGPELTVLSKGTENGIGFNNSRIKGGPEIRDFHFEHREQVVWLNDQPVGG
jgi:hypothetical protein